jgi:hypothetical protein
MDIQREAGQREVEEGVTNLPNKNGYDRCQKILNILMAN